MLLPTPWAVGISATSRENSDTMPVQSRKDAENPGGSALHVFRMEHDIHQHYPHIGLPTGSLFQEV